MIGFGQILTEIGEFGVFQKRLLVAICIPNIFTAFHMFGQIFTGLSFSHHCNTSWILNIGPNLTYDKVLNLTVPLDNDGKYQSCEMFTPVDQDLETIEMYGLNRTTQCTDGWIFSAPEETKTIITEVPYVIFYIEQ